MKTQMRMPDDSFHDNTRSQYQIIIPEGHPDKNPDYSLDNNPDNNPDDSTI
jgi:hypothetical protein